jgi:hypothetical protein
MAPSSEMKSFSTFSKIPTLKLRKDIWAHFPVCLLKHPDTDGRDRYSVQWHRQKLQEWSQGIPMYESVAKVRLLKALRDCDKWSVESAAQPQDICVIAMNFSNEPKVHPVLPAIFAPDPPIHTLEDLKDFFPVCWKQTKNAVSIEFHNTLVRALSERFKMPEPQLRAMVQDKLVKECQTLWNVQPSVRPSEICRLLPKQA